MYCACLRLCYLLYLFWTFMMLCIDNFSIYIFMFMYTGLYIYGCKNDTCAHLHEI